MSAASLYGRLTADLANDYQQKSELLHRHSHLINRFGEAIKTFNLTPHVRPEKNGAIALVAVSNRGDDAMALQAALTEHGAEISEGLPTPTQFNDGFVMWTAPVLLNGVNFTLLFYIQHPAT
jgi:hypothetical protein